MGRSGNWSVSRRVAVELWSLTTAVLYYLSLMTAGGEGGGRVCRSIGRKKINATRRGRRCLCWKICPQNRDATMDDYDWSTTKRQRVARKGRAFWILVDKVEPTPDYLSSQHQATRCHVFGMVWGMGRILYMVFLPLTTHRQKNPRQPGMG